MTRPDHARWPLSAPPAPPARPDVDPPTVRNMLLPTVRQPLPTANRDLMRAALRDTPPARRWVAQRLVAMFACYETAEMPLLPPATRRRAEWAIRTAERLLDVPAGTVVAAAKELRTEQNP